MFGGKLVLEDKNGKVYKLDPEKLSKEDQLYLNPPPPRYKMDFARTSKRLPADQDLDAKEITSSFEYGFKLMVEFLTDDPVPDGLRGVLIVVGEDEQGTMLVIDKADGPIEKLVLGKGQLESKGCQLSITKNKDGKMLRGVKYKGYLMMLLTSDGTVLEKKASSGFLTDNPENALTLLVDDKFNKSLEKL